MAHPHTPGPTCISENSVDVMELCPRPRGRSAPRRGRTVHASRMAGEKGDSVGSPAAPTKCIQHPVTQGVLLKGVEDGRADARCDWIDLKVGSEKEQGWKRLLGLALEAADGRL